MSRITRTRIAVAAVAALAISCGGPAASAYWQTLGSNPGSAKADAILALATAPTATASAGGAAVSWAQGSTAGGRAVYGYNVSRYASLTGGTKIAAGGGCAGTITALSCSEAALPAGTWYYTVTPVLGSWVGGESARSGGAVGDATAPLTPTITVPAIVNSDKAASVPISISAEAASSVKITVTDTPPPGTPQQTAYLTLTADGSVQATSIDLSTLSDGIINYSAVATDASGNSSIAAGTATSTKDTAAPTAKVTLANQNGNADQGDTVSIKYSADIDSNSICSAWSNAGPAPDITGNGVVTVTINAANILTVTTTTGPNGAPCAPKIGPVTLGPAVLNGVYVSTGTLTFKGNGNGGNASKITWNNSNQTLTITLGSRTGTANSNVVVSSPTVAPPAGVADTAGNQAVGASPAAASRF